MRQNAMTDPVDSDHLISAELVEKLTTAMSIANSASERPLILVRGRIDTRRG
jgi:hypothetical protein